VVATNAEVRIAVILIVAILIVGIRNVVILNAVVDLTSVAVTNAAVRIAVIPIAAIPNGATQDATGDFPNEGVRVAVLSAVQDVARVVVIQNAAARFAAARCVQVAVFQCVVDLDALVVLQNAAVLPNGAAKILPNGARVDVLVDRLAPAVVHAVQHVAEAAVAQAPVLTYLRVALSVVLAYCPRRERCVARVHFRPHYAGSHLPFDSDVRSDRDVHRAVDPLTRAVQDDSLRLLAAFRFAEFPPCLPAVKIQVSALVHGRYECVLDPHRAPVLDGVPLRQLVDWEYLDAAFEPGDLSCRRHARGPKECSRQFHQYGQVQLQLPDRGRLHCAQLSPRPDVHDDRDYRSRRAADA